MEQVNKDLLGQSIQNLVERLDQVIQVLGQPKTAGIRWVSVEEFAGILNEPGSLAYLKRLLNPNLPARTQREFINPDDLIKAGGKVKIRYSEVPIKGVAYPRIEKKPLKPTRAKDWNAVTPKGSLPVLQPTGDDRKIVPGL